MRFSGTVEPHEKMKGLEVPEPVVAGLGGGSRARVVVTINGYTWRTAIAKMQGRHLIGLANAHRTGAGLTPGDVVEVTIELDTEPLTVAVPPALAEALDAAPEARAAFGALTVSQRRQHIRLIEQAKTAATRERRIAALVEQMRTRPSR